MTPEEIGARLVETLGGPDQARLGPQAALGGPGEVRAEPDTAQGEPHAALGGSDKVHDGADEAIEWSVSGGGAVHARVTVDVPTARWVAAATAARDDAALSCDFFDWLSAVDELDDGFSVVAHLWSTKLHHGLLLRTRVARTAAALESVVGVYPGAGWHERETHEMFGIDFPGHPGLTPLLLPPEFEGHPLRKEFVLASRVAKPWPGAKEPGESHDASAARRQPMRPPGVPDPNEWGPAAARKRAAGAQPEPGFGGGEHPPRSAAAADPGGEG